MSSVSSILDQLNVQTFSNILVFSVSVINVWFPIVLYLVMVSRSVIVLVRSQVCSAAAELPRKANTKPSGCELGALWAEEAEGSTNANTKPGTQKV